MGKTSKYEGGSTIVSFRLPTASLEEAKRTIEAYLMRFEVAAPGPLGLTPLTPEECFEAKDEKLDPKEEVQAKVEIIKEGLGKLSKVKEMFRDIVVTGEENSVVDEDWIKAHLEPNFLGSLETEKHKKPLKNTHHVYPCGCSYDGVLFRRSDKCHLEVEKHIK